MVSQIHRSDPPKIHSLPRVRSIGVHSLTSEIKGQLPSHVIEHLLAFVVLVK